MFRRRRSLEALRKLSQEATRFDSMPDDALNVALETSLMQAEEFHRALRTDAPKEVVLERIQSALETGVEATRALRRRVEIRAKDW